MLVRRTTNLPTVSLHYRRSVGGGIIPPPNLLVKGEDRYLYRAVDFQGNTLDFLLTAKRNAEAAKQFLPKAMKAVHTQEPRVINVDKNADTTKAIDELKEEEELSLQVELRQNKVTVQGVKLQVPEHIAR